MERFLLPQHPTDPEIVACKRRIVVQVTGRAGEAAQSGQEPLLLAQAREQGYDFDLLAKPVHPADFWQNSEIKYREF
jgi:hypothetical protein